MPPARMRRRADAAHPTERGLIASAVHERVTDEADTDVAAGANPPRIGSEQIPAIAFEILEHDDAAVRFLSRRRHEANASLLHALIRCVEIIDAQKQPHASRELLSNNTRLVVAIRASQQNSRARQSPRLGRPHDHPALRPPIVGQRGRVLDEIELQDIDEKPDRRVIVPHHQCYEFELRHLRYDVLFP
jgi:hypothetical protein